MPTGFRMRKSETAAFGRPKREGTMRGRWRGAGTADMDSDGDRYRKSRNTKAGDSDSKKRRRSDDEPEAAGNDRTSQPRRRNFEEEGRREPYRSEGRDRPFVRKDGNDKTSQPRRRNFEEGRRDSYRSEGRDRPFVRKDGNDRTSQPRQRNFEEGGRRDSYKSEGQDRPFVRRDGNGMRGMKPGYGRERRFVDGDSNFDKRSYGDGGGVRGRRWQKDDEYGGGRDYRRNEGGDFGGPVARRKEPSIPKWKLGKVGKGDFKTDKRGNGDGYVERHHRGRSGEDHGRQDSYRNEGRDFGGPVARTKGPSIPKWKLGKVGKGDFETDKRGNGDGYVERHHRGRKGEDHGRQDSYGNEGRDSWDGKPGLKGRRRDEIMSSDKRKGEAESDKYLKGEDKLDESGKKIDGGKKSSGDVNAETDAAPRKRSWIKIKLHRYDLSNKRWDDVVPSDEKTEKDTEEEIQVSKNAQFRAITPSPAILSFVEDNLLGRRRLLELQKAGYNIKIPTPLDNTPTPVDSVASSTSTERVRIEEPVFRNKLEFFAAAKVLTSFPPPVIPEIAFAGRSNVGKSSLLNALTRQWGVVRTSDKPGHTQTINFFRLASKICLVDLPGYGFAYAKEEVKDSWEELVKEYVSTRVGLQRVCLLIDTKWGMKPRDIELIDLMETHETPYQIVLTKTDISFPIDVARRAMHIQEKLKANKLIVNPVMMVSTKSGAGIRSLRSVLATLTRFLK